VTPVGEDGAPEPYGQFERHGASDIYRENGKRMIAVTSLMRFRITAGEMTGKQGTGLGKCQGQGGQDQHGLRVPDRARGRACRI
jgi:hypothetical protein